ncbi:MAG: hypothetical protein LW698_06205 [Planctomycetaceae bacterium]|nr:hypothetical protein [Planctomycetaceae bacterium]
MSTAPAAKPPVFAVATPEQVAAARAALDAHTVEIMAWHFHESTGCPFWLEYAKSLNFSPLTDVKCYDDLKKFPPFEDEWLRGGPVRRWVPKGLADQPAYVFETGGTTGIPKSRYNSRDFRTDYEMFSDTLPEEFFPKGANWLMLGPSGPRRLRLSIEHLAQHRGGICFCVDLDPRWVIKLIQKGWMEHLEAYKQHCIDQAITILVHAAVDPLRRRGVARRRLHDSHLRQHADGSGGEPAGRAGRRLHDRLLRPAATSRDRGGRLRRPGPPRALRWHRPRPPHDAHEGDLHPRLLGAGRG